MSASSIIVEGLGKQYRLGARRSPSRTFRELVTDSLAAPFRRRRAISERASSTGDFWALKDVSFEVKTGDVVGIIGRNGAGKSTLLKILSQIVEPTEGRAILRGRVASLLEVGTGFHPELSGRENVFLNGSILGMRRREIEARFDEIVAFAEVERFLDTPVKYYSSGMYVRLAFAVAAHLDPEILVVDEVLAVGDVEFQRKCLGKMKQISEGDATRTVLFVSHNMAAVTSLCSSGILLEGGRVAASGPIARVVHQYLGAAGEGETRSIEARRPPGAPVWIDRAELAADGAAARGLRMGDRMTLRVWFGADPPIRRPMFGWVLSDATGTRLLSANNRYQSSPPLARPAKAGVVDCRLGLVPLMPGRYSLSLYMGNDAEDTHVLIDAMFFEISAHDAWGEAKTPPTAASALWWPAEFLVREGAESAAQRPDGGGA